MAAPVPDITLDEILAIQLTVAWAGEGRCEPRRLGWWDTDVIDEAGGGDFFARLLPKTHVWAALEAAREAARRVDADARQGMAAPDAVRSLFFLGFALDEQLDDRLAMLKRQGAEGVSPNEALALPLMLDAEFDQSALEAALALDSKEMFKTEPTGRLLQGVSTEPQALVRRLAAALVPLGDHYPLPYIQVNG